MKLSEEKKGYIIHEIVKGKKYAVCRILNEYDSDEAAQADLIDLITNNTTDEKLLSRYKENVVI